MSGHVRTSGELENLKLAETLNEAFAAESSDAVLRYVLKTAFPGKTALVSSFGAESAVLLSLVAEVDPGMPVFFLDTYKHFEETLEYVERLRQEIGLGDVRIVQPDPAHLESDDPGGTLHALDPDRCCHIRKTLPMIRALRGFKALITGRKRFQNALRADLNYFEVESGRIKVNPLVNWTQNDLKLRAQEMNLPPHPLVKKGYLSIGCAPCTSIVSPDETDPRAGRWRGHAKTECGIHFVDGKLVRTGSDRN